MTVPNTTYQTNATGDGATTAFDFTWRVTEADQVQVYLAGVLQNSGYSVALSNITNGGTVTFTSAPGNGVAVLIQRNTDFLQTSVLLDNAPLPVSTLEAMFDKLTIECQQLNTGFSNTIQLPQASYGIVNPVLPTPVANSVIAFNSTATGYVLLSGVPTAPATTTPYTLAIWDGSTNQQLDNGPSVGTTGELLMSQGAGQPPVFAAAPGTSGYVLTSNGPGVAPTYQAASGGGGSGDVNGPGAVTQYSVAVWGGSNNTLVNGPSLGSAGQVLTSNGNSAAPSFQNVSATTLNWTVVNVTNAQVPVNNYNVSNTNPSCTIFLLNASNLESGQITLPALSGVTAGTVWQFARERNYSTQPLFAVGSGSDKITDNSGGAYQAGAGGAYWPSTIDRIEFTADPARNTWVAVGSAYQQNINAPGTLWEIIAVTVGASSFSLTITDFKSLFVLNASSGGTANGSLPAANNTPIGMTLRFFTQANSGGQTINLNRTGSDVIYNTAGSTVTTVNLSTAGTYVELTCISSSAWLLNTL